MSVTALLINLEYDNRYLFAVPVPEWSTQHELIINRSSSWIKYPSPKGWHWLKLPLDENYSIIGLSTSMGLITPDGILLKNGNEIFGTILRSHIVTNAKKHNIVYKDSDSYLVIEMFLNT